MARREEVITAIRQREQEGFDTWQIREERSIWTGVNAVVGVGRLGGRCRDSLRPRDKLTTATSTSVSLARWLSLYHVRPRIQSYIIFGPPFTLPSTPG